MKSSTRPLFTSIAISCLLFATACTQSASEKKPSAAEIAAAAAHATAVEAAMATAEEARGNQDWAEAANAYLEVIRLDPSVGDGHSYYKMAAQLALQDGLDPGLGEEEQKAAIEQAGEALTEKLGAQYAEWIRDNPEVAGYQWGYGQLYMYKDYDKVEEYARKALELDPDFAPALGTMALLADVSGDRKQQAEYLRRAAEANPDNASSAFYYTMSLRYSDRALYREKALEMAKRFPDHERGAQALHWLAVETEGADEKLAIYQQQLSSYPPEEFSWSSSSLFGLFEVHASKDPRKALEVAETMKRLSDSEPEGSHMVKLSADILAFQQSIVAALGRLDAGEFQAAVDVLAETKPPRGINADTFYITKARALRGAGAAEAAYELLVDRAATEPTDASRAVLATQAEDLGISSDEVNAAIKAVLTGKAEVLEDYSFERYDNGETVSLSDFRGKVVLLNFWYPFCGPCRGENPHLQETLEKYGPDGFVILALNVYPKEDKFVMPYATGNGFDFIQLRSDMAFAEGEFQARGMPTNFLIDTEGRKVLRLPPIRKSAVRTLELQIESLLPNS